MKNKEKIEQNVIIICSLLFFIGRSVVPKHTVPIYRELFGLLYLISISFDKTGLLFFSGFRMKIIRYTALLLLFSGLAVELLL